MSNFDRLMGIANRSGLVSKETKKDPAVSLEIEKNKRLLDDLRSTYGDSTEVFNKWKQAPFSLNEDTKEYWWSTYESLNPNDTKEELQNQIRQGLNEKKTLVEKDYFLRESFSKMPKWVSQEYENVFGAVQQGLTRQQMFKSEAMYQRDLQGRLSKFAGTGLDSDVPSTQHAQDFVRLERLNLLDVAAVQNGRVGVLDSQDRFRPAYTVSSRGDVFEEDAYGEIPEQEDLLISSLAPSVVQPFVDMELEVNRTKAVDSSNASSMVILNLLREGKVTRDKWDSALASTEGIDLGQGMQAIMEGQINSRQASTKKEIASLAFELAKRYGDLDAQTG